MSVKRVIFIRPGETDWNREERWQGWVAAPLNDHGKRQVYKLASFVRNLGVKALYSSDLKRAEQTAEILAHTLGFAPVYDERLRERNIGAWQGLTLEEMRAWYPDEYEALLHNPDDYVVPNGEARAGVRARMRAAFDDIVAGDAETVAILSHTTAIRMLLTALIPDCDERGLGIANTSVTSIMREGNSWQMVVVDDVSHLEGLDASAVSEVEYGI